MNKERSIICLAKLAGGCIKQEGFTLNDDSACTEGVHDVHIEPNILCVNVPCSAVAEIGEIESNTNFIEDSHS